MSYPERWEFRSYLREERVLIGKSVLGYVITHTKKCGLGASCCLSGGFNRNSLIVDHPTNSSTPPPVVSLRTSTPLIGDDLPVTNTLTLLMLKQTFEVKVLSDCRF